MLPPYPGVLPKGATRIRADRLSAGDIVFLETASSGEPIRSLILETDGAHFKVMNRLNPDPYLVYIPRSKEVWALKIRPWAPKPSCEDDDSPREPTPRYTRPKTSFRGPFGVWQEEPEDFRSYWNWDPKDRRAGTDFYSVEEREWQRLRSWWESQERRVASQKRQRQTRKPSPSRIDSLATEWYRLLNIRAGVTLKELKSAYKKAAFKYHPDRCKDSNAEEMFKRVSDAYQGLLALLERKKR